MGRGGTTEERRVEVKHGRSLSDLLERTVHLLLCPSKIFRHGNKNTASLVMVYSALFYSIYVTKAFILFLNKYVPEIQLPGNGIWLLSIPQRFYTEF